MLRVGFFSFCFFILLSGPTIQAQFKNIKLDDVNPSSNASAPSITINSKDTRNMVASTLGGSIQVTFDGGENWEKLKIISSDKVVADPLLISDEKGNLYFFHVADSVSERTVKYIVSYTCTDGGKTWSTGTSIAFDPQHDQLRPRATTDNKGNVHVVWTSFDVYGSKDSGCHSMIMMSSSSNGKKWSKPVQISQMSGNCLDGDSTTVGGFPAVSEDKKRYVAWSNANKIFFDRSFDGGGMWLRNDITITDQPGGWDFTIPGHDKCNGVPVLVVEKTKGQRQGMLYIAWADQRRGADDTDIWFMRSSNFGDNWSSPLKVNDDGAGKHQYLPWTTIDQTTGNIYILYYDRRAYDDNQTDVYLAYSVDAGTSFKNVKISETPFNPETSIPFAAHLNITAHKGVIIPIWSRIDNGKTSIWTTTIKQDQLK